MASSWGCTSSGDTILNSSELSMVSTELCHQSGVFLPWDLETTPNTPFIAQVHHLFNLHTPLGRDVDRTGA